MREKPAEPRLLLLRTARTSMADGGGVASDGLLPLAGGSHIGTGTTGQKYHSHYYQLEESQYAARQVRCNRSAKTIQQAYSLLFF